MSHNGLRAGVGGHVCGVDTDDMSYEIEPSPRGVARAILFDVLLGLGHHDPASLTAQEQARLVEDAARDGRVDPGVLRDLREVGVLPAE